MSDRSLDSLSSDFYPKACELIARVTARRIAVLVVQTSRTVLEHQANLAAGTSGAKLSLHLPRKLRWPSVFGLGQIPPDLEDADREKCDAIDLAPYEVFQAYGPDKVSWNTKHYAFGIIGEEAERLGLRWGGRWLKPFDPGHAELVLPWTQQHLTDERARPWPAFDA